MRLRASIRKGASLLPPAKDSRHQAVYDRLRGAPFRLFNPRQGFVVRHGRQEFQNCGQEVRNVFFGKVLSVLVVEIFQQFKSFCRFMILLRQIKRLVIFLKRSQIDVLKGRHRSCRQSHGECFQIFLRVGV